MKVTQTLVQVLLVILLISSCSTTGIRQTTQANVVIFDVDNSPKFRESQKEIESVVYSTVREVEEKFPLDGLTVNIFNDVKSRSIIKQTSTGGYIKDENRIFVYFNINSLNHEPEVIIRNIRSAMLHEIGHCIHFRSNSFEYNLFEYIVTEGFADHFANNLTSSEPYPWSVNLTEEEINNFLIEAEEHYWTTDFDVNKWVWGSPKWIVYSLGYKIIGDYITQNPGVDIIDLMARPTKEIYESITIN